MIDFQSPISMIRKNNSNRNEFDNGNMNSNRNRAKNKNNSCKDNLNIMMFDNSVGDEINKNDKNDK